MELDTCWTLSVEFNSETVRDRGNPLTHCRAFSAYSIQMNKKALNHIKNERKLKFYIPSKYAKYTIFRHKITQFLALTNNPLGRSLCYKFRSILSQKPHTYFSRENSSIVCWKLSRNYIFSLDEPCDIHLQLQSYCIA